MAEITAVPETTPRLCSQAYLQDVRRVAESACIDWERLKDRHISVSGATGQIGTFLIDVLMERNHRYCLQAHIHALGRNHRKAERRLPYFTDPLFSFEQYDLNDYGSIPSGTADLIFHLASTTHPRAYATRPISTITSNVLGLMNLLGYASQQETPAALVFASSVEVYGQNRGDTDDFTEDYCGYIDCNTLRAGYPESKRCCEALCQAFLHEKHVPVYLPRIPRTFGPTLLSGDSKAVSQFLKNGLLNQDIVLKSAGAQYYSFLYIADVVEAILTITTRGESGLAYNIADKSCNTTLLDLAKTIAATAGTHVIHQTPDSVESTGYSIATHATMDATRLHHLGWKAATTLPEGIRRTLSILGEDPDYVTALRSAPATSSAAA